MQGSAPTSVAVAASAMAAVVKTPIGGGASPVVPTPAVSTPAVPSATSHALSASTNVVGHGLKKGFSSQSPSQPSSQIAGVSAVELATVEGAAATVVRSTATVDKVAGAQAVALSNDVRSQALLQVYYDEVAARDAEGGAKGRHTDASKPAKTFVPAASVHVLTGGLPSNARRSALSTSSSRLSLEPTKLFSAESITAPSNDEPQPQHNPPHAIGAL